ncbi:hypothetical protein NDU88_003844 [Pleurodeles waltl]|uniref:Uncharacterized protein n=1 Tax=Pleurodeles waltl TaxID=8319 RepID=A0AAV7PAR2_PLEWA|nr:hypothetical protein NDU88_003844 [Pleurodeles waltl]
MPGLPVSGSDQGLEVGSVPSPVRLRAVLGMLLFPLPLSGLREVIETAVWARLGTYCRDGPDVRAPGGVVLMRPCRRRVEQRAQFEDTAVWRPHPVEAVQHLQHQLGTGGRCRDLAVSHKGIWTWWEMEPGRAAGPKMFPKHETSDEVHMGLI